MLLTVAAALALVSADPPRVASARQRKAAAVEQLFTKAGVPYPPAQLYLRIFKSEAELEVWAGPRGGPLVAITTYPVCAGSGTLGPKRAQGDLQVPEGFYVVDRWNPTSQYHLSLHVDYPNALDRTLGATDPGGDIFIHGECVTIGCVPIENDGVEELYLITRDAAQAGAAPIVAHFFPARLDPSGLARLRAAHVDRPELAAFWDSLATAYTAFEQRRRVPRTSVDARTKSYRVVPR
jgi:murein L,D-transpeptidase YafK